MFFIYHCCKIFAKSYALESVCKNLRFSGFGVVIVYKNLVSISITVKFCKRNCHPNNRKPWFLIKWLKRIKPSLSSQGSLVWSLVRDFFCICFVWLCSQREVSQTKLMQTKPRTKLRTRLHWLERLDLRFDKSFMVVLLFPTITWKFGYIPTFADVKSKHDMG